MNITDLKAGVLIELGGSPYRIISSKHLKLGRGGAIMQTKLRNLTTGAIIEKNFRGAEKVKPASLERRKAQYLYYQDKKYFFMDSATFDQFSLSKEDLDDKIWYLKDGSEVEIEYYKGKAIGINLPIKMEFKVKRAEKGERGDRVSAGTKPITLETGLIIQAPLFINEKDVVRIDTRDGSYVERAK